MIRKLCPVCRTKNLVLFSQGNYYCFNCECKTMPIAFEVKEGETLREFKNRLNMYADEIQIGKLVNLYSNEDYSLNDKLPCHIMEFVVADIGLRVVYSGESLMSESPCKNKDELLKLKEQNEKLKEENERLRKENTKRKADCIDLSYTILQLKEEIKELNKKNRVESGFYFNLW